MCERHLERLELLSVMIKEILQRSIDGTLYQRSDGLGPVYRWRTARDDIFVDAAFGIICINTIQSLCNIPIKIRVDLRGLYPAMENLE
jgi:hypothetical protein